MCRRTQASRKSQPRLSMKVSGMSQEDEKVCPDCAERILAAARVCRYCGYRFDGPPEDVPSATPSSGHPSDADSATAVQRAYRELLGNDYEPYVEQHVLLSGLAAVHAQDFDTAWKWQRLCTEGAARKVQPHGYRPTLITDTASAMFGFDSWYKQTPAIGARIGEFVKALNAKLLVVSYATTSSRKQETYVLQATDGFVAREASWAVEHARGGRREVTPMRRGSGPKNHNASYAMPAGGDPTVETTPSEGGLLGAAAFELRENANSSRFAGMTLL